jgi:chromosome segregation ATPase
VGEGRMTPEQIREINSRIASLEQEIIGNQSTIETRRTSIMESQEIINKYNAKITACNIQILALKKELENS